MKEESQHQTESLEPTKSELEILQVLWELGPSTVRAVNERLNEKRNLNYSSTLKLMQIMLDKGLLARDERQMKHVYRPVEEEQKTKSFILDRFVKNLFNGSPAKLMMQLVGNSRASKEELDEMKKILDQLDNK